uniref:Putative secreted protein n=1 Tax=Ixodes ricinus TaxID=34613 RepID=A0A090XET5_IXORI
MQRYFAYVVVFTILATEMPSSAEGDDTSNGKADQLFQFLRGLGEDLLYTIKRSYNRNLKADEGATVECVKAIKLKATDTDAVMCTIYKAGGKAANPFKATYQKKGEDTIEGNPGSFNMTVLYVGEDERCFVIHMLDRTSQIGNGKACDMLSAMLGSSGGNCEREFTDECGSESPQLSTEGGCSDVPTPVCTEMSQLTLDGTDQV